MFTKLRKILNFRSIDSTSSNREIGRQLDIPSSTVDYQLKKYSNLSKDANAVYWTSEAGELMLKRIIIGVLYVFGIKGGVGAERIEEFFEHIRLMSYTGLSSSSILRIIKEIELCILRYQELQEQSISEAGAYAKKLNVVLGLDETWLTSMLLVCQDLSSGYLFLKNRP